MKPSKRIESAEASVRELDHRRFSVRRAGATGLALAAVVSLTGCSKNDIPFLRKSVKDITSTDSCTILKTARANNVSIKLAPTANLRSTPETINTGEFINGKPVAKGNVTYYVGAKGLTAAHALVIRATEATSSADKAGLGHDGSKSVTWLGILKPGTHVKKGEDLCAVAQDMLYFNETDLAGQITETKQQYVTVMPDGANVAGDSKLKRQRADPSIFIDERNNDAQLIIGTDIAVSTGSITPYEG